jgi:hypothetical protein
MFWILGRLWRNALYADLIYKSFPTQCSMTCVIYTKPNFITNVFVTVPKLVASAVYTYPVRQLWCSLQRPVTWGICCTYAICKRFISRRVGSLWLTLYTNAAVPLRMSAAIRHGVQRSAERHSGTVFYSHLFCSTFRLAAGFVFL